MRGGGADRGKDASPVVFLTCLMAAQGFLIKYGLLLAPGAWLCWLHNNTRWHSKLSLGGKTHRFKAQWESQHYTELPGSAGVLPHIC